VKATVSIKSATTMQLAEALLIYRSRAEQDTYVTLHPVTQGQLGPAQPLTHDFLTALAKTLSKELVVEVLPPNILARAQDVIVWWTPASRRPMFFTDNRLDKEQTAELSGQIYPHPPLVWMVRGDNLYVRALATEDRPGSTTPLMVAPYWNVSANGLVCCGDMTTPDTSSVDGIPTWESGFFNSKFSHPNTPKPVNYPGGYLPSLIYCMDAPRYDNSLLIPAKQTLGQFIKESR